MTSDVSCNRDRLYLPIPRAIISNSNNDVSNKHDSHVGDHGPQSHLGLANPAVPLGQPRRDEIRQRARREQADQGADQYGEVEEANLGRGEVVGRGGERLGLREVQGEEPRRRPGHDERGKLDDGEDA